MGFLSSGLFWGVLLILLGLSVILKAVFHIDLPLFRILFAVLLIYLGVRVLVGERGCGPGGHSVLFGRQDLRPVDGQDRYAIIFAQGSLDLSELAAAGTSRTIELSTIFGEGRLIVPQGVPFRIEASAAFASVRLPNGNSVAFGTMRHADNWTDGGPGLDLRVHAVFGEVTVEVRNTPDTPVPDPREPVPPDPPPST